MAAVVALLAAGAGFLVGRYARGPLPDPVADTLLDVEPPKLPDGASQVLDVLRSSTVVVGPHDEVVQSSPPARTQGLVRGTRVAVQPLLDLVRQVRRDQEIHTVELELDRGPGTPVTHLGVRVAPLGEELVLILSEDRTVAHRVEQTRRDFVANVSHELKTPIGAVTLLAEAMGEAADDPEAVSRFARRMVTESDRLSQLVKQLIELSRLQADDPLMGAADVDVDEVMVAAADACRVDAERRGITLTLAGERGLRVVGDQTQLTTAIRNLVHNGVAYSDTGARVTVAARQHTDGEEDYVDISVSDNGIGISATEVQRIFERFYRVDYARSRDNGGTGLGLSIVKHIAAAHGGQVSVWSKLGQGSTFTVQMPAHPDMRQNAERTAEQKSLTAGNPHPQEVPR